MLYSMRKNKSRRIANRYEKEYNKSMSKRENYSLEEAFEKATGKIPYGMTNDYMFRAVFQKNPKALKGLICALLHLNETDVSSIEITNPIVLGQSIDQKEFRLDINVCMNNKSIINLEMQVANQLNWVNRSLSYLCRSFDRLRKGQNYSEAKPVIHIGFLDYTLFEECPEFHATYKMMNEKNHHVYSGNFVLSVVDLSQIDLATDEDKMYRLDYWARLFKATTWEEIKMLASKDENIMEASKSIFQMSADEIILKRCEDREDYYQDIAAYEHRVNALEEEVEQERIAKEQERAEKEKLLEWARAHGYEE